MHEILERSLLGETYRFRSAARWRTYLGDSFPWLERIECGDGGRLSAEALAGDLGGLKLFRVAAGPLRMQHRPGAHAGSHPDYLKIVWVTRGHATLSQDRRVATLAPGGIGACDTRRPYDFALSGDGSFLAMLLERHKIAGWSRISIGLCATDLGGDPTLQSIPWTMAGASHTVTGGMVDRSGIEEVTEGAIGMLTACLHRLADTDNNRRDGCLESVRRYIRGHVADPNLSPDRLARALHMSRRKLYNLLRRYDLTPCGLIRETRLDLCRRIMGDPGQRHRSITEIALSNGFTDPAHFSRLFKRRNGLCPHQWRQQVLAGH